MHWGRSHYYVIGKEGRAESKLLPAAGGGCPMAAAAAAAAPAEEPKVPSFKFGRMFWSEDLGEDECRAVADKLIELGTRMSRTAEDGAAAEPPNIPAGYTYLGQFIAHEITFHKTGDLKLSEVVPDNMRSPNIDLDSLYGKGPGDAAERVRLYDPENGARLKVGRTTRPSDSHPRFDNDLPREPEGEKKGVALIGDPRNDENLPVAQTHVAFIKFHNRVVDDLEGGHYKTLAGYPEGGLFETAKAEVVRHFQWVVLNDYLPRIVDGGVLKDVIGAPRWRPEDGPGLFMPLEFSAAAFRLGHSMVRLTYNWNQFKQFASLNELFTNSQFGGTLDGFATLNSDWVIDWKRFFDFREFDPKYPYKPLETPAKPWKKLNMAGRIDTAFDLHLEDIKDFPHHLGAPDDGGQPPGPGNFNDQRALTVRNLLRGLSFGLPYGEGVAGRLAEQGWLREGQELMTREELIRGPHRDILDAPPLKERTPLWFYVLKEAKEKGVGGRLGCVGSRIVAETLVGLIRNSEHSILKEPGWRPAYGRDEGGAPLFGMVDLLIAANVVDSLGEHLNGTNPSKL